MVITKTRLESGVQKQDKKDFDISKVNVEASGLQADLFELNKVMVRMRRNAQEALQRYKAFKADKKVTSLQGEKASIEGVYSSYLGILMRNQLKDAFTFYKRVNKDYHEMKRKQQN